LAGLEQDIVPVLRKPRRCWPRTRGDPVVRLNRVRLSHLQVSDVDASSGILLK
jgi:hypothetical protein